MKLPAWLTKARSFWGVEKEIQETQLENMGLVEDLWEEIISSAPETNETWMNYTLPKSTRRAAIVFLIDITNMGPRFLACFRRQEPYLGMWTNPGGKVEEGELAIDAAFRELKEETGLLLGRETVFDRTADWVKTANGDVFMDVYFVRYIPQMGVPRNMEPEKHGDWVWMPLDVGPIPRLQAMDLGLDYYNTRCMAPVK